MIPKNKYIIDLPTLLGYRLSKVDFSSLGYDRISYGWGDESEVKEWINKKDRTNQFGGNVYDISNGIKEPIGYTSKYPLIWLEQTPQSYGEYERGQVRFDNSRLIISCNTKPEYLNPKRWEDNIIKLQTIADLLVNKIASEVQVGRRDGRIWFRYSSAPKFSVRDEGDNKNKTLDWWDAVIIELDLVVNSQCKDQEYYNNYFKC